MFFQDILQDPEIVIVKIAKFLGYTTSRREVEDIKEKIKFSNMKQVMFISYNLNLAQCSRVSTAEFKL